MLTLIGTTFWTLKQSHISMINTDTKRSLFKTTLTIYVLMHFTIVRRQSPTNFEKLSQMDIDSSEITKMSNVN